MKPQDESERPATLLETGLLGMINRATPPRVRALAPIAFLVSAWLLAIPPAWAIHSFKERGQRNYDFDFWPSLLDLLGVIFAIVALTGLIRSRHPSEDALALCALLVGGLHVYFLYFAFRVGYSV